MLQNYNTLIVCEGMSDTIIATECGFCAIGKPSAQFGDQLVLRFLQKNNIQNVTIVADDCDKPYKNAVGQRAAKRLNMLLREQGINSRVVVFHGAKDLRDYYNKFGKKACQKVLSL